MGAYIKAKAGTYNYASHTFVDHTAKWIEDEDVIALAKAEPLLSVEEAAAPEEIAQPEPKESLADAGTFTTKDAAKASGNRVHDGKTGLKADEPSEEPKPAPKKKASKPKAPKADEKSE